MSNSRLWLQTCDYNVVIEGKRAADLASSKSKVKLLLMSASSDFTQIKKQCILVAAQSLSITSYVSSRIQVALNNTKRAGKSKTVIQSKTFADVLS